MWVPDGDAYYNMDLPLPSNANEDFEGYLTEQGVCGTGEVDKVACILTDPVGTQRTLGYTCEAAMNITDCGSECPEFEYKVIIFGYSLPYVLQSYF